MGIKEYQRILERMVDQGVQSAMEIPEGAKSLTEATVAKVLELRSRLGAAKMVVLTSAMDFLRCIYGQAGKMGCAVSAYVCTHCHHQPKNDFVWFVTKTSKGNKWNCAHCGCEYKRHGKHAFMFGIQMSDEPDTMTYYSCSAPDGKAQNIMNHLKCVTALQTGVLKPEEFDAQRTTKKRII